MLPPRAPRAAGGLLAEAHCSGWRAPAGAALRLSASWPRSARVSRRRTPGRAGGVAGRRRWKVSLRPRRRAVRAREDREVGGPPPGSSGRWWDWAGNAWSLTASGTRKLSTEFSPSGFGSESGLRVCERTGFQGQDPGALTYAHSRGPFCRWVLRGSLSFTHPCPGAHPLRVHRSSCPAGIRLRGCTS